MYALKDTGALYRKDATTAGAFQAVTGVPAALFQGGQGWYDIVLAADPSNANVVYLGGDYTFDGDYALALFKGTIAGFVFPFNAANASNAQNDPTWIGRNIDSDGHCLAFATNAGGTDDATSVSVGCDGGVFASTSSGALGTFVSKNDGLAITEVTFFGQRWDTDAVLVAGAQDQGSIRFRGEQVCYEAPEGDGGGIVVDPNNAYNMMRQYVRLRLYRTADGDASGSWTDLLNANMFPVGAAPNAAQSAAVGTENANTSFYSQLGVSPSGIVPTLVTFGTNRLWLTSDWGTTWVTLPTATNPYAGGGVNAAQDVLLPGQSVVASVVASATLIFVATRTGIWKMQLSGTTWTSTSIVTGLPAGRVITALAVENAATPAIYAARRPLPASTTCGTTTARGTRPGSWPRATLRRAPPLLIPTT